MYYLLLLYYYCIIIVVLMYYFPYRFFLYLGASTERCFLKYVCLKTQVTRSLNKYYKKTTKKTNKYLKNN